MKTILITGGTGFIGTHLIRSMKTKGYKIVAMVRLSSNTSDINAFVDQYIYANLNDLQTIEEAIDELKNQGIALDFVIHGAALTKAKNWEEYETVNVHATQKLAICISEKYPSLKKFIFISSLAAAGPQAIGKTISLDQSDPITKYGKSKLLAESLLKKTSVNWFMIRPTAVYGPREKDLFVLYKNIYAGISPIIGNHKQELTFIHVSDLVDIIIKSVEIEIVKKTIYAADGNTYSKQELARIIEKRSPKKTHRITIPLWLVKSLAIISEGINLLKKKPGVLSIEKFGELKAESWNCDLTETHRLIEFKPNFDLQKGLENTLDWYENNGWLKKTNK